MWPQRLQLVMRTVCLKRIVETEFPSKLSQIVNSESRERDWGDFSHKLSLFFLMWMMTQKLLSFYLSCFYYFSDPALAADQTGRWPGQPLLKPEASSESVMLP